MSRFARLVNAQLDALKETSHSSKDSPSMQTSQSIKDTLSTPDRVSREQPPPATGQPVHIGRAGHTGHPIYF
jgi:hypothetical protein